MADKQEPEKTYEVKDKRRLNPDGTVKEQAEEPVDSRAQEKGSQPEETAKTAEPKAQEPAETPKAEAEEAAGTGEPPIATVYDILQLFAGMLSEQAWQKMGLRLAPGQKEMTRDMVQAKVAIDTIVFIADKLHPHINDEERRALRGLVSDLQLNFVKQSQ